MKNTLKLLMLIFVLNAFTFCTAEDLNEDNTANATENVQATGGDTTDEVDNDRDDG